MTLGQGGGRHAAVFGSITYSEHLVPTLAVLSIVYAHITTFVLFGVVTGPITRLPLLQAVLPAHVEAHLLCAEVRAGDCGSAVFIAEAVLALDEASRTVQLSAAEQSFHVPIIHT